MSQIVVKEAPIKKKKHGRLEKSVLRVGLDLLRELFFKIDRSVNNFVNDISSIFNQNTVIERVFTGR
ncbi:hypothetical protein HCUR_00813 [Holospora curviuscula]|uniref:Uncharacterized protein n=1 Tax=Holospora curviuscula TaxID=1082868 RepID=A0A2S5R8Z9_9PROT|nr:hypothetical protein HCUR_00813 [Holospora curviuscula]